MRTLGLVAVTALAACATAEPPAALLDARAAYNEALRSPAYTHEAELLKGASKSLEEAEEAARRNPESSEAISLSYLALRRLETILARGQADQARIEQQHLRQKIAQLSAQGAADRAQSARLHALQSELQATRQELETRRRAEEQELSRAQQRLESERQEREQEREQAEKLAKVAKVREDERGLVLTLSGSVLFASGKSTLLPVAQQRLEQVAQAFQGTSQTLVIEGHTDSTGPRSANEELSQRRADRVRSFLADRGIAPERMRAQGMGDEQPVADNATADGRADNRRVEIVVSRAEPAATGGSGSSPGPR